MSDPDELMRRWTQAERSPRRTRNGSSPSSRSSRSGRQSSRRRRRNRRIVVWSIAGVLVLLVAGTAWIGIRAWMAKGELEAAVPLASKIESQIASGDAGQANTTALQLLQHASEAARLTDDPVWRVGELIPWIGTNLTAFREAAAVINSVASDAILPLASNVASIGTDSFQPVNGTVAIEPLVAAQQSVSAASAVLEAAAVRINAIDTSGTISEITNAVSTIRATVADASGLMIGVDKAVTLLPRMLGSDGPRNYLLLFQNPAELRAGGGVTSALALVTTNDGSVSLVRQASSSDISSRDTPVVALPDETRELYSDRASTFVQNTTLVPEFDLTGQIASGMWTSQYGDVIDGVVSFDPVALSYLLKATGPIELPTGDQLTSENAVQFLLSDVYSLYPDPKVQDVVFAGAAKAVFDRVSAGGIDPRDLLDALVQAGSEGRLKIWSAHPEDQEILAGTTLAGDLPPVTHESTGIGVYFNDATGAKMDYYLDAAIATEAEECRADNRPAIRVAVTLTNNAPADAGSTLPEYVTGGGLFGVTPGNIRTLVYVYGPKSEGEPTDATVVTKLDPGIAGGAVRTAQDQGRTVAEVPVELAPGESRTITVDYLAQEGNPLEITPTITPMVNPTVYSTEINRGFSGCKVG